MHIISRKALRQFWQKYPDSEPALIRWFKIMNSTSFETFDELRSLFPSADLVGDLIVFRNEDLISCAFKISISVGT
ncbi:MAG: type II toxin-antitoxin system HigB family toxin, partial [Snowella sp.]